MTTLNAQTQFNYTLRVTNYIIIQFLRIILDMGDVLQKQVADGLCIGKLDEQFDIFYKDIKNIV